MRWFLALHGICKTSTPCIFHLPVSLLIFPFYLIRNTGFDAASPRRLSTPGQSPCSSGGRSTLAALKSPGGKQRGGKARHLPVMDY